MIPPHRDAILVHHHRHARQIVREHERFIAGDMAVEQHLDSVADDTRRVLRQWRELPVVPWTFRPRAWSLLALAALEQRSGDEIAAGRCREEARRHFVALADAPGLAYLASPLSGR